MHFVNSATNILSENRKREKVEILEHLHYGLFFLQISHGGLILMRNVKPDETEEIVEPVVGMYSTGLDKHNFLA